jgi:hypothetical protein
MNASPEPSASSRSDGASESSRNDQAYRLGRRPRAIVPYPFSTEEFAGLLILRGQVQGGQSAADDLAAS